MVQQKVMQAVLKNWREILIILSLSLVTLKTHLDYRALNKAYETSKEEMRLQISSLSDIHAEELRQRDEALQTYREAIEQIERNYLESQEILKREREAQADEYVRQFSQDKEGLANEIINTYGFELVE
jgi:hypothetical protein